MKNKDSILVTKINQLINLAYVTFTDTCESATYAQLLKVQVPRKYHHLLNKIDSQRKVHSEDVSALELMKK